MTAARTYAEWMLLFDHFVNGDDTVFEEMDASEFVLDAGTAQRFCTRAEEAYKKRKQNWLDKFQRSFTWQRPTTADDFGIVLRDAKQNMLPLVKFVTSNGLPEELRKTLHNDLISSIAEIRKSLKDNILKSRDRSNTEKLLLMVSTLDVVQPQPQGSMITGNDGGNTQTSVTGRKIIF
ncbi:MAG: hypothetical protein KDB87_11215 [Flavobacteriales bacterium]|nr:hypothetical protein [Flavobacteriales bacterium]